MHLGTYRTVLNICGLYDLRDFHDCLVITFYCFALGKIQKINTHKEKAGNTDHWYGSSAWPGLLYTPVPTGHWKPVCCRTGTFAAEQSLACVQRHAASASARQNDVSLGLCSHTQQGKAGV